MGQIRTDKSWHGIKQITVTAAMDPDAAPVTVKLPAAWGQHAADALTAILPHQSNIDLAHAAETWIEPIAARAQTLGLDPETGSELHALLAQRRGCPTANIWRNRAAGQPGFVFNLCAFLDDGHGFDIAGLGAAVRLAVTALTLAAPAEHRLAIGFTDLHLFLTRLGLAYDLQPARDFAVTVTAYVGAHADIASAALLARGAAPGYAISAANLPQPGSALPELTQATKTALAEALAAGTRRHETLLGFVSESALEALLGAETLNFAPAMSPINSDGSLCSWARHRLCGPGAFNGISPCAGFGRNRVIRSSPPGRARRYA